MTLSLLPDTSEEKKRKKGYKSYGILTFYCPLVMIDPRNLFGWPLYDQGLMAKPIDFPNP
jgi:hypothetical protein